MLQPPTPTYPAATPGTIDDLRRALWWVLLLTIAAGVIEVTLARITASSALQSAGIDWGYDAALYVVGLAALGRGLRAEHRAGWAMAAILVVATVHLGVAHWLDPFGEKDGTEGFSFDDAITLAISFTTPLLLLRFRNSDNLVAKAAFISALANLATDITNTASDLIVEALDSKWLTFASGTLAVVLTGIAAAAVIRQCLRTKAPT